VLSVVLLLMVVLTTGAAAFESAPKNKPVNAVVLSFDDFAVPSSSAAGTFISPSFLLEG
jgi:hypothetical protein